MTWFAHNLVDHNQHTGLCMFRTLHVSVNRDSESVVKTIVGGVAIRRNHGAVAIPNLGGQQEDVGSGIGGQGVQVFQHTRTNSFGRTIHDEMHIHVHRRTSLPELVTNVTAKDGKGNVPGELESR